MTLAPLLVAGLGLMCFVVHLRCKAGEDAKRQLRASYVSWFLLGTYLIYPSVSTTLFQTLRCEVFAAPEYEGDEHVVSYLRADLRLECGNGDLSDLESGNGFHWDSQYNSMWQYAIAFIFVYPIGEWAHRDCPSSVTLKSRISAQEFPCSILSYCTQTRHNSAGAVRVDCRG